MRSYSYDSAPATVSLLAGMVLFGSVATSIPQDAAMDRYLVHHQAGHSKIVTDLGSPTAGLNVEYTRVSESLSLSQVSSDFVATISEGMHSLEAEFYEVIEDNFWDLVLR